jgi:hypothetical protein
MVTASSTTAADGTASAVATLGPTAGSNSFSATITGLTGSPVVFAATGTNAPATALQAVTLNNQSFPVDTPTTLTVKAVDASGKPVKGVDVTWQATGGGGGIVHSSSTDSNGLASSTATMGPTVGMNTFTATASALVGVLPVTFTELGVADVATHLVFLQPPTTAQSGELVPAVQVAVEDGQGNLRMDSTASITVNAEGLHGGAQTQTAVQGIATFNALVIVNLVGTETLTATSSPLTEASITLAITTGKPSQLAFGAAPPASAKSGAGFPGVTVKIEDSAGNLTLSTAQVAIASSGGALLGGAAVAATAGVATFNALSLSGTAGNYVLTASSSGLSSVMSNLALGAGDATKLAFLQAPGTANSGGVINGIEVAIQDAAGNLVTTASPAVTLSASGATVSGSSATAANGVATFAGFSITGPVGNYTLSAASQNLLPATSPIAIVGGSAGTKLVFTQAPASAQSGAALPAVSVSVRDGNNNLVDSSASISLSSSGGTLAGGSPIFASHGVATFSAVSLTGTAGNYLLTATSDSLTSANSPLALTAGTATQLVFTQVPATASSGIALGTVKVSVEDVSNNVVLTSTAPIAITASGGTLTGGAAVNAVSGVAVFNGLVLSGAAGSYQLSASSTQASPALASTVSPLTLGAGAPVRLAYLAAPPASTRSGSALSTVTVGIEDAAGNVTNSTASVALASSGGTLLGGAARSAVNGVATFAALSFSAAAGNYVFTASSTSTSPVLSSANAPLAVAYGDATQLAFTIQPPASAQSGVAMPAVQVSVEDSAGNVVASSSASIAVSASGGTLTGGSGTAVNGVATFSLSLKGAVGTYTLTATGASLQSATSSQISLGAGTGSQLVFTQSPAASAQSGIAFPQPVKVALEDASGNVLTGSSASISLTASGGTLTGGGAQNAVNGIATFALSLSGLAGNYTLSATSSGAASATSGTIALSAGNPAQLVFTQPPPGTAKSGVALSAVKVSVEDGAGNVVTSSSASVSLSASAGTLTGGGSLSAAAGVATFAPTLSGPAGNYTLSAASSGLPGITSGTIALGAGNATQLVFTQQPPATGQSGIALSQAVKVSVEDGSGNVVTTSTASISLTASGGTLTGGAAQVASAGVATFSLTLAGAVGNYTLTAASSGVSSATSSAIALSAGTPTQLVFTQQPPVNARSGTAMPLVKVSVEDSAGNVVTSSSASIGLSSSGGTMGGGTAQAASNGVVSFTPTLTGATGTYSLSASSSGFTSATSTIITLGAGDATQLVFTQQPPATAQSDAAFSGAVKVALEDSAGNVATSSNAAISLTANAGTLTGGTSQTATNGVATFSLKLKGLAGNYTLAAASSGLTSVNSTAIALGVGAATQLVFTQQPPVAAQSGSPMSAPSIVSVEDSAGNVITASTASIGLTASAGTLTGGAAQNAANGAASFTLTLSGAAGNYTLTAAATGLASATSNVIALAACSPCVLDSSSVGACCVQ